jgi:hypothetical protein
MGQHQGRRALLSLLGHGLPGDPHYPQGSPGDEAVSHSKLTPDGDDPLQGATDRYRRKGDHSTAYGIKNIMSPLGSGDITLMRETFPEVPTGGLVVAAGEVSLLMGQDNLSLFPT